LFGSVAPAAGSCVVVVVSLLLTRLKVASVDNAADAVFLLGLGYGIGSIVGVVAFRRQIGFAGLGKITMMFDRGRPRTLASFSVYGAFTIALSQADLWAVGLLGGAALAGAYGFATKFVALVALPLFVFNGVAANRIVQLEALGAKERLERMLRGGAALSVLAAAGTLLCVAIAFPMMAALYENKLLLEAGLPVLVILGVGQLVNAFTGSCGVVLLYVRGQAAMLKIIFLTVGSAVMALAILGEGLGTTSVASIFFCAMLAQNVLMLIAVKRATGLRTQASFRGLLSNPSAVFADLNTVGRR
jgi:O-antigen/teichoic acid export membrane protein